MSDAAPSPTPGDWAGYIKAARARLRIAPTAFGRLVGGKPRQTIQKWENGDAVPDSYRVIAEVARAIGDPVSDALVAAGAEDASVAEAERARRKDEKALELIRSNPQLTPKVRRALEAHLERLKDEHEAERVRAIELQIQLYTEMKDRA